MIDMLRRVRARVPNVALGVIIGVLVGGGAYAVAQTGKTEGEGVHGGPKPRFHDAKVCDLVDVSKLPGNWTHGDYVSAVEKEDPSKVREAAHSPCGKPNHAGQGKKDKQKGGEEPKQSTPKAKPSAKPSTPGNKPSASPSPTGSASPIVPLEPPTTTPSPTGSASEGS